jgi:hypothetical protein
MNTFTTKDGTSIYHNEDVGLPSSAFDSKEPQGR